MYHEQSYYKKEEEKIRINDNIWLLNISKGKNERARDET